MGGHCRGSPLHPLERDEAVAIQEKARVIYTIGHSTLPSDDFVALLQCHAIETVADVRRFPISRKNPQYAQEMLRSALSSAGIHYAWVGDGLGGYRSGGYEAFMHTSVFEHGIIKLEGLAREARTVIMCAEKHFLRCHRRFIADALAIRGWRVLHVVDESTPGIHTLEPSLF